jgi:tRNA-specific 2-thiouridylase
VIWCDDALDGEWSEVTAQVRAHHTGAPARVAFTDSRLIVQLLEPIRGLATGQTVAIYRGSQVLGSGRVISTERAGAPVRA